jgi:hypothetical protein
MRVLAGYGVLLFFTLLAAAFVVGLAGFKGSDATRATGFFVQIAGAIFLVAAVLGTISAIASIARPAKPTTLPSATPTPGTVGPVGPQFEGPFEDPMQWPDDGSPARRNSPSRAAPPRDGTESRTGGVVGLLGSIVMLAAGIWLLLGGSKMSGTSLVGLGRSGGGSGMAGQAGTTPGPGASSVAGAQGWQPSAEGQGGGGPTPGSTAHPTATPTAPGPPTAWQPPQAPPQTPSGGLTAPPGGPGGPSAPGG